MPDHASISCVLASFGGSQRFAAASAETLEPWKGTAIGKVGRWGGGGFVNAASFTGHLIERGLPDHDLVRRHLVKPLIAHHYVNADDVGRSFRAMAIYYLFVAAKDTLLQGLLEPEDIEACFKAMDIKTCFNTTDIKACFKTMKMSGLLVPPDTGKLNVRSFVYPGDSRLSLFANL